MREHVTVIPVDQVILVNGEGLFFPFEIDSNIHAIQWHNGSGHIEYTKKDTPNKILTTENEYNLFVKPYVNLWENEFNRVQYELNKPLTFEETYAFKYAEIIGKANDAKDMLSSRYSTLEEATWPEQEAGARAILNDEDNVKNINARLILKDEIAKQQAVSLVEQLATIDNVTREEFSSRIITNADLANQLGILTLTEQRNYESLLRKTTTVEGINDIVIDYTVLKTQN